MRLFAYKLTIDQLMKPNCHQISLFFSTKVNTKKSLHYSETAYTSHLFQFNYFAGESNPSECSYHQHILPRWMNRSTNWIVTIKSPPSSIHCYCSVKTIDSNFETISPYHKFFHAFIALRGNFLSLFMQIQLNFYR